MARSSSVPENSEPRPEQQQARGELVCLLVVLVVGCGLRAAVPSRMAVEHFDEGVYASNLYAGPIINPQEPFAYPDRHLYAPPLFPAVLESVLLLTGGESQSVLWVNVLVGSVTVLAVWWVARSWFGPVSAVIAALLAATSEYHIAFSRSALTDPLLCLWMLTGVYAAERAFSTRRPLWIAAAGLLAGLAWCTKYNGWLTLAITGSGAAAWAILSRRSVKELSTTLLIWAGTGVVAFGLFWYVVLRELEPHGGYAAVAANHARYFVGLEGWWGSLWRQFLAHRHLDGWITLTGIALALPLGSLLFTGRFTWNGYRQSPRRLGFAVLATHPLILALFALLLGTSLLLALRSLWGFALAIRAPKPAGPTPAPQPESVNAAEHGTAFSPAEPTHTRLAGWMLIAWFFGLLVGVPLYHAYPRLSLPWLIPCWLAAGATFSGLVRSGRAGRKWDPATSRRRAGVAAAVLLLIVLLTGGAVWRGDPFVPPRFVAWQDRRGMERVAAEIVTATEQTVERVAPSGHPEFDAVFYVYGEPALFYHLESVADETSLRYISQPAGNLDVTRPGATDPQVATFLVTGLHAEQDPAALHAATASLELLAVFDYAPSDLVLLDRYGAADPRRRETVRLYLLHPPQR